LMPKAWHSSPSVSALILASLTTPCIRMTVPSSIGVKRLQGSHQLHRKRDTTLIRGHNQQQQAHAVRDGTHSA
jgi:hypothetical protein